MTASSQRQGIDWQAVDRLLKERSEAFIDLVRAAGLNPATEFRFADLRGVDFGEADLSGFDLSGANCEGANFSQVRGFDPAHHVGIKIDDACLRRSKLFRDQPESGNSVDIPLFLINDISPSHARIQQTVDDEGISLDLSDLGSGLNQSQNA